MLRRLHPDQPESFAFTPANLAWAEAQITKYPEGRQASAIIPLLWRAQEQEGWLSRPAIEHVATMLDMSYMRALEVATFYFMFQLQPVGSVAHIQICGTTSCMICGAEDLMAVCREKIAPKAHQLSADGRFSWEEVECLGACANAPMAQIGKDYYEDLTADSLRSLIDRLAAGEVPTPGSQTGRFASEPASGLTSLTDFTNASIKYNASVQRAVDLGETIKRIDGTEEPLRAPWGDQSGRRGGGESKRGPEVAGDHPVDETGIDKREAVTPATGRPDETEPATAAESEGAAHPQPHGLTAPRDGKADDLTRLSGVDADMDDALRKLGLFHYDQFAALSPGEVTWLDTHLKGDAPASRGDWVAQAKTLLSQDKTD